MNRLRFPKSPASVLRHLKRGGIIAYPTESCYGLGCLPQHNGALRRLIRLKKRAQDKGMIVIGSGLPQLLPLLDRLPESQQSAIRTVWPARKTLVLPANPRIPVLLRGKRRHQVAVRVPDHEGARQICRRLNTPLVSTSCNRAGKRVCRLEREVKRQFGSRVWIIGGRIGNATSPSTIIDWISGKQLR